MLKHINLQLLAEPSAADPGTGTPAAPAATSPAVSATPTVTFTPDQLAEIDKMTATRTTRAEQSALQSYFQQQGLSETQAAEAIKSYKETNKSKVTPEAQALIDAANQKAADAMTQANATLIKADATIQAGTLQIRADRIDTVLSMADISKVKVTDNKVDSAAVKAAIEAVLAKFPEWKTEGTPPASGFRVGADGKTTTGSDDEALRRAFGLKPKT